MSNIGDSMSEVVDKAHGGDEKFMNMIALVVAILATITAIFNIKDSNIVQAMQAVQTKSANQWSYYQSKSTKQSLAESMLDQLTIERRNSTGMSSAAVELTDNKIAFYKAKVARYEAEKEEIKIKADEYDAEYERLNMHDDQLDIAEACITVAISLFSVAALTKSRKLVWFAFGFAAIGLASGFAEFTGLNFRIDFIAHLLS